MLTAEKKQSPNDPSSSGGTSTVGGFSKVLNSIQGLQERLGDFSLDEVIAAEANANTLIQRIRVLQEKLHVAAEYKRGLNAVATTVAEIPEPDFDLISPASLEKHPQLHAIVKTNKIIRLHKLLKVAKASAESVSFNSDVGRLEIGSPLAPTVTPTSKEKYPKKFAKPQAEPQAAKPAPSWKNPHDTSLGVIELPPVPTATVEEVAARDASAESETLQARLRTASDTSRSSEAKKTLEEAIPEAPAQAPASSVAESRATTASNAPFDMREQESATATVISPSVVETPAPHIETEARVHDSIKAEPQPSPSAQRTSPRVQNPEFADERRAGDSSALFNQRLLDDLIDAYGEVFVAPKPAAKPAPIVDDIAMAPEPNFVEAESQPFIEAIQEEEEEEKAAVVDSPVPSVRSHGELDRQLKKIIKDYGEYDIYSHHSSLTLKKGGIAAFIVLALVLAGVYFFRSPAQTASQPAPAAQINEATPTAEAAKEGSEASSAGAKEKSDGTDPTALTKTKAKQKP